MSITQSVGIRSLRYPERNADEPYCHLWCALLYIFPHYLINGTVFKIKVVEHRMCFEFLYSFRLEHFSI